MTARIYLRISRPARIHSVNRDATGLGTRTQARGVFR